MHARYGSVLLVGCLLLSACGGGGGGAAGSAAVGSSANYPGPVPPAPTAAASHPATPAPPGSPATPAPLASDAPAAGAIADLHVMNWAYYGSSGEPAGLSADWMARHVSFVDAPAWNARPFKAAGGKYAVAYTDPFRVVSANHEPLWDLPESAWMHDAGGNRIFYNYGGNGTQYQLNPASPLVQSAYAGLTQGLLLSAPYDFVEMDDVHFDRIGAFFNFNAPGIEVASDGNYDAAIEQLIASSAIPVMINGLSSEDFHSGDVSGNLMFLDRARGGINNEGCLQSAAAKTSAEWVFDANTLLATTQRGKLAVCWGMAPAGDARAARTYFLASWWLTYDRNYSVAFADFASRSNLFVFPEYEIVPTAPRTTATTISDLQSGGAYVREFAACYQAGKYVGSCAAVANPGGSTVPMPALRGSYRSSLMLGADNSFEGGAASWSGTVPTSLAAQSGVLLLGP